MQKINDLLCIIYANESKEVLDKKLSELLKVREKNGVYYAFDNEIVIMKNLDYDKAKGHNFPDGFLYFQNCIEVYPQEPKGISLKNQIKSVATILEKLWADNIPAVAAADYENQLPNNGGYKCRDLPWEK